MEERVPRDLDRGQLAQLLSGAKSLRSRDQRIEFFSSQFLKRPYKSSPLIGSRDCDEVLTAALDGFDCVTYIETVLALAHSSSIEGFIKYLRKVRYQHGRTEWKRRNHYMTDWIRNNARGRIVGPVSVPGVPMVSRERSLNVVPGLRPRRTSVRSIPKGQMPRLEPYLKTGDLIFFASTRRNLDVFHAGIIVRAGQRILMRHASRSQGGVVEQDLRAFLKENRMAGMILARPL